MKMTQYDLNAIERELLERYDNTSPILLAALAETRAQILPAPTLLDWLGVKLTDCYRLEPEGALVRAVVAAVAATNKWEDGATWIDPDGQYVITEDYLVRQSVDGWLWSEMRSSTS